MEIASSIWDFAFNSFKKLGDLAGGTRAGDFAPLKNFHFAHETLNGATSLFWMLAYASLLQKIRKERSAKGVSFQSLLVLMITELSNLAIVTVLYVFYNVAVSPFLLVCDTITGFLSALTFWRVVRSFSSSYEEEKDTFGLMCCPCFRRGRAVVSPNSATSVGSNSYGGSASLKLCGFRLHWLTLYVLATMLAVGMHAIRRKKLPFWLSMWECYTDALTAMALIPQLYQFHARRSGKISDLLCRFVFFLLIARLLSLCYWVTDVYFHGTFFPGRGVHIAAEALNVVILLDFAFYYATSRAGNKELPEISLPI
eukprot:CAMPEP_0113845218 /NCGR_PEP_ID=MMETSP0372-20130328/637_1 /TAXON_ID=340204 /ORGANISM="Lankesteria abbotti" /LENGTH=311 /DNA_ID=CAMNT_0000814241 /DNA_START=34 /DNA_END=969 /DNA_ORIENTATION=+ /assembly_acc=CAM_ASM_000359